jgi:hypothetical protein
MTIQQDLAGKGTIPIWPDAARIIGVSRNSAYLAAQRGDIPVLKIGGRLVVPVVPFLKMLGIDSAEAEAPVEVLDAA